MRERPTDFSAMKLVEFARHSSYCLLSSMFPVVEGLGDGVK